MMITAVIMMTCMTSFLVVVPFGASVAMLRFLAFSCVQWLKTTFLSINAHVDLIHKIPCIRTPNLIKRRNQYIMMLPRLIHDKMGFKREVGACEMTPKS